MRKLLFWTTVLFLSVFVMSFFGSNSFNKNEKEYIFGGIEYNIDSVLVDLQGDGLKNPIWGNFYLNIFVKPPKSSITNDIVVEIFPKHGVYAKMTNPKIKIDLTVTSGSFEVVPKSQELVMDESWSHDLEGEPFDGSYKKVQFILTPKSIGQKKIRVTSKIDYDNNSRVIIDHERDNIWKEKSEILDIEITEEESFLGLTKQLLDILKLISGLIGFPALAAYLIEKHKLKSKKSEIKEKS